MKTAPLFLIVLALCATTAIAADFFLKQIMYEGESKDYNVGDAVYRIEVTGVFDSQLKVQFKVNGETTKALSEGESDKLSDGSVIQARDILPQEGGEGKDMVQFNFFPASAKASTQPPATETATTPAPIIQPAAKAPNTTKTAAPAEQPAQQTTEQVQKKAAAVDMTKTVQKKSLWARISDWFKSLFD